MEGRPCPVSNALLSNIGPLDAATFMNSDSPKKTVEAVVLAVAMEACPRPVGNICQPG
jgi:hypothetical protein